MKPFRILLLSFVCALALISGCGQKNEADASVPADLEWLDSLGFAELAPWEELVSAEKIQIASEQTDLSYGLDYGRSALELTCGLRAEDGTEYSTAVTGGSERGTIGEIPAGTYQLFVRNSGDYSDYPSFRDGSASYDAVGCIHISLEEENRNEYAKWPPNGWAAILRDMVMRSNHTAPAEPAGTPHWPR